MSANIHRLRLTGRGNEALAVPLDEPARAGMIASATAKLEELFDILSIDHRNDHNTSGTPRRVARMFVNELFDGRYSAPPPITGFDNALGYDDLIVSGPIELRSTCAHHLLPIVGHAFVGIVPAREGRIIGLSKYDRIIAHFAARLQIQEEMVKQIAEYIAGMTHPAGVAVRISAVHMCKTQRGVRSGRQSRMVSSAWHGTLNDDAALRQRFLQECVSLERAADRL